MAALAVAGAAVVARAARSGRLWPLAGGGRTARPGLRGQARRGAAADRRGGAVVALAGPRARRPRLVGLGLLGAHFVATRAGVARGRDRRPAASAAVGAGRLGRLAVARGARLQRDRQAAPRQRRADRAGRVALRAPAHATPARRSRWRARRASTPPRWPPADAARAAAPALGPRPPGPVDRLSRPSPHWRRSPSRWRCGRWRGLDRVGRGGLLDARCSGSSPASRCAAPCRACARATWPAWIPPWRRAWGRESPSPCAGARARAQVAGAALLCAVLAVAPRHGAWPPCATAPRRRGARGRCRRRAWRRCRTSCARTRPARPTRSPSARRPRPGR